MREERLQQFFEDFGLDEFQRIAVMELCRDLEQYEGVPEPDSEHERLLRELGAIVTQAMEDIP